MDWIHRYGQIAAIKHVPKVAEAVEQISDRKRLIFLWKKRCLCGTLVTDCRQSQVGLCPHCPLYHCSQIIVNDKYKIFFLAPVEFFIEMDAGSAKYVIFGATSVFSSSPLQL